MADSKLDAALRIIREALNGIEEILRGNPDRQPGESIEDYALRSSVGAYRAAESEARPFVDTGGNDHTRACN